MFTHAVLFLCKPLVIPVAGGLNPIPLKCTVCIVSEVETGTDRNANLLLQPLASKLLGAFTLHETQAFRMFMKQPTSQDAPLPLLLASTILDTSSRPSSPSLPESTCASQAFELT